MCLKVDMLSAQELIFLAFCSLPKETGVGQCDIRTQTHTHTQKIAKFLNAKCICFNYKSFAKEKLYCGPS